MRIYHLQIFTTLILLICLNLNNSECVNNKISLKRLKRFKPKEIRTTLVMAPALLLTTSDTISLIYPKEMGYEKDFLHMIYKINSLEPGTNDSTHSLRIEDAVYDNQTWSIYCLISNSSGGSEIVRLKHLVPNNKRELLKNRKQSIDQLNNLTSMNQYSQFYQIASNWSRALIYKNETTKILSLDINVKKRKIYWFEFNILNKKWSLAVKRINNEQLTYFTFEDYSKMNLFSNDGYSFITIASDTENKNNIDSKNDITLFISNNQTLNICYLTNMTCEDYFRAPVPVSSVAPTTTAKNIIDESYDDDDDDEYSLSVSSNSMEDNLKRDLNASKLSLIELPPLYKFGRLMGIKYDKEENALYLSDYGNDRIEKITFERNDNSFKFTNIETILKSDFSQAPINPMMSVFYDSYIFWIDFEEGLKTTVFKSSCIRTIYKAKEATNLRFIQIGTYRTVSNRAEESSMDQLTYDSLVLNRLVSIQETNNGFQYPPDYYNSISNDEFSSDNSKLRLKLALKSLAFRASPYSVFVFFNCFLLNYLIYKYFN